VVRKEEGRNEKRGSEKEIKRKRNKKKDGSREYVLKIRMKYLRAKRRI
jgi:hypothetical protein